jgi:long-chain acyl-CoA synthetase
MALTHDQAAQTAQANIKTYSQIQALPEIWSIIAKRPDVANLVALHDPHSKPEIKLTFAQLYQNICQFAAGYRHWGCSKENMWPNSLITVPVG